MVRVDRLYLGPMSAPDQLGRELLPAPDQLGSELLKHNTPNMPCFARFRARLRLCCHVVDSAIFK
jgi:hypothetical protein